MRRTRVEPGIYRQQNGTYGTYLMVNGKPTYKTVGRRSPKHAANATTSKRKPTAANSPPPPGSPSAKLADTWIEGFEAQVASGERGERTLENYRYHLDHNLLPPPRVKRLQEITHRRLRPPHRHPPRAKGSHQKQSPARSSRSDASSPSPSGAATSPTTPSTASTAPNAPGSSSRNSGCSPTTRSPQLLAHTLPRYRPLLATAIYTGMRLSELLGLTWQEIDLEQGLIHVRYQLSRGRQDHPATPRPPQDGRRDPRHPVAPPARRRAETPQARLPPLAARRLRVRAPPPAPRSPTETSNAAPSDAPPDNAGLNPDGHAAPAGPRPPPHLRKPPHHRPQTRRRPRLPHPRPHTPQHHPRHLHPPLPPRRTHRRHPPAHGRSEFGGLLAEAAAHPNAPARRPS